MDYGYDYDAVGNITEKRTEYGLHRYQYDNLDRLTVADYPNGPQNDQINDSFAPNTFPFADDRYSYDLIGNRQTDQAQTATTPWAYNGNNELLHAGFAAFNYNAAGSTIGERDPQTDAAIRTYRYKQRRADERSAWGSRRTDRELLLRSDGAQVVEDVATRRRRAQRRCGTGNHLPCLQR